MAPYLIGRIFFSYHRAEEFEMFPADRMIAAEAAYRTERIRNEFGHHRGEPTTPVRRRRGRRLRTAR